MAKTRGEAYQSCMAAINKLCSQNPELGKMYEEFLNDTLEAHAIEQLESKVREHIKNKTGTDVSKYL